MHAAALLLLLLPQAASVHGTVRAEGSMEPIPYASVRVSGVGGSVAADEHGYFAIPEVPAGTRTVRAVALGYQPAERTVEVPASGHVEASLELTRRPVRLSGLEVTTGTGNGEAGEPTGTGEVRIDPRTIEDVPALAEADVLRTAQLLPAVSQTSDFSTALYIRGAAADQTLVTLDGAPLFNPYHLGGIFSAVDPGAVSSIDVLPGAFPARTGGDRLGGVVHLRTRDGSRDRIRGHGGIGLVSARAGLDGPLPGGGGSFLVSARRTYLDLLSGAAEAVGLVETSLPYGFTDAHAKLTHDVGDLGRLSGSFYLNSEELRRLDEFGGSGRDRFTWGSHAASLDYRQPLWGTLLGEVGLAYGDFGTEVTFFDRRRTPEGPGSLREAADVDAFVSDLVASAHLTWHRPAHVVRMGAQLDAHRFRYDVERSDEHFFADLFPEFRRDEGLETIAAYLEDDWAVTDALDLRAGARVLHAPDLDTEITPRIGVAVALSPRLTLSAGAGRYAQALHGLRNEEGLAARLLSYELLSPVPASGGLQTARDLVVGGEWTGGNTRVRVDAYAKQMRNLVLPGLPPDPNEAPLFLVDGFSRGTGSSHGFELLARHGGEGGIGLQGAYALRFTEYTVGGEDYPPGFSRRHSLDLLGTLPLGEDGELGARLQYRSGQPYTPVVGAVRPFRHAPLAGGFSDAGRGRGPRLILGEHNTKRLPFYWRLDVSARKRYEVGWFGRETTLTLYGQVLNLFNQKNVLLPEPRGNVTAAGVPELEFTPQLPILPTIGVEWSF